MAKLVLDTVALRAFRDAQQQASESNARPRLPLAQYRGTPIHLTAKADALQPGEQGAAVNVKALMNPGPGPIEVHAIKFRLRSTLPPSGAIVACKLALGDFPLTSDFIPVYSFGKAEDLSAEVTSGSSAGLVAAKAQFYATYVAKLSRPIFLPAGATINAQLAHKGQTSVPVDVTIALIGRALPANTPEPKKLWLPYWATYITKTFTLGAVDSHMSTENDLINPFNVPLMMERFVGRIGYYVGSNSYSVQGAAFEDEASPLGLLGAGNSTSLADAFGQINCSIIDSNGYPVVKKLTPFRLVFDLETRAWPLSHSLPPGGYYLVSMTNAAWTVGDPTSAGVGNVLAQPCITMLGWREVA